MKKTLVRLIDAFQDTVFNLSLKNHLCFDFMEIKTIVIENHIICIFFTFKNGTRDDSYETQNDKIN